MKLVRYSEVEYGWGYDYRNALPHEIYGILRTERGYAARRTGKGVPSVYAGDDL